MSNTLYAIRDKSTGKFAHSFRDSVNTHYHLEEYPEIHLKEWIGDISAKYKRNLPDYDLEMVEIEYTIKSLS